jgi:hypothetical protein
LNDEERFGQSTAELLQVRNRVLNVYGATIVILLALIGILLGYTVRLGPLVGPGVEESFGIALAILFLAGALLAHVVDRTYRVWPLGRSVAPLFPGFVTDRSLATLLKAIVIAAAVAGIGYLIAVMLTS